MLGVVRALLLGFWLRGYVVCGARLTLRLSRDELTSASTVAFYVACYKSEGFKLIDIKSVGQAIEFTTLF